MLAYVVRDATDASNAHFAVYDTGTVRHIGGVEAGWLLNPRAGYTPPKLIAETDRGAIADLYRDSATYQRPPWWGTISGADLAPYKART